MPGSFEIETLDHVAIRVPDVDAAADWYQRVLGLRVVADERPRSGPLFLLARGASRTGVAIFPRRTDHDPDRDSAPPDADRPIDHYAFRVSAAGFADARRHLEAIGEPCTVQDHGMAISLYMTDPGGATVELTTYDTDEARRR
ncbi:MAG: VOC family protein [Phycisphaerales bacterium]